MVKFQLKKIIDINKMQIVSGKSFFSKKIKLFGSFAFIIRSFVFCLARISMPSKTLFCKLSMANITLLYNACVYMSG